MAIFTVVEIGQFSGWAEERYSFNSVGGLLPITEGIENTNYCFVADEQSYIFTVFELWKTPAVAYYAALMQHLAASGLPVVAPLGGKGAAAVGEWAGKPCLVVPFKSGKWKEESTPGDCQQMGDMVAKLHIAAGGFVSGGEYLNPRGRQWRVKTGETIHKLLNDNQRQLLDAALRRDAEFSEAPLPKAACHCDLFRNNVLWDGGRISAVIDFYFGGEDALIFDLAVCACDWCFADGEFSTEKLRALMNGYSQNRRLTELEKRLFPDALHVAAARFWISRHYDKHFPRQAEQLTAHDPKHFEDILRAVPQQDKFAELMAEVAA